MTSSTITPAPSTVTPLGMDDIAKLGRYMYSLEVQGSKLDLMAYDASKSQQKLWTKAAKKMVRAIEATGRTVTVEG